ncbi:MAG TPA: DMT family transporter [Candidatus Saccharimonadia bacterium]
MKYRGYGSAAVITASLLFSLDGLLRRQLYSLPPSVIVFWEHVLGFLILAPIVFLSFKHFRKLTIKQWRAIIGVSFLSGALGTILYTSALTKIQFIPFSVVVLLQQLQPIFAIAAAAVLLKEPLTKKFFGLSAVALAAAYFVSFPNLTVNWSTGNGTLIAALFAVGAAIAWGSSTAFSKYALKGTSSIHVTAARFGITPFFALGFVFVFGGGGSLLAIQPVQWLYLVAITFSTGLVALAIYYFGLKRIPASRATILELTWPLSAVVIGYIFLDQGLSPTQILGMVVLMTTVYFIARDAQKLAAKEPDKVPESLSRKA